MAWNRGWRLFCVLLLVGLVLATLTAVLHGWAQSWPEFLLAAAGLFVGAGLTGLLVDLPQRRERSRAWRAARVAVIKLVLDAAADLVLAAPGSVVPVKDISTLVQRRYSIADGVVRVTAALNACQSWFHDAAEAVANLGLGGPSMLTKPPLKHALKASTAVGFLVDRADTEAYAATLDQFARAAKLVRSLGDPVIEPRVLVAEAAFADAADQTRRLLRQMTPKMTDLVTRKPNPITSGVSTADDQLAIHQLYGLAVEPLSRVVSGIDAAKAVLHLLRTRYDDDIARESMDVGPVRGSPLQTI